MAHIETTQQSKQVTGTSPETPLGVSSGQSLCRIVPAGQGQKVSSTLSAHIAEMLQIVKKILSDSSLEYRNETQFWESLHRNMPIVRWQACEWAPGGIELYLLCPRVNNYDPTTFFSEMCMRWLIPGKQATILGTSQLAFRFVDVPDESYFVAKIFAHIEDDRSLEAVLKNLPALAQEISLGAVSLHHARHILVTKALTQEHKTSLIHKAMIDLSSRRFRAIGAEVFFEMHHFLLASDDEFKALRDVRHMCRIICYHNWFRRKQNLTNETERQVFVKPLRTTLHFQFGEKPVLGLVIALSHLKEYEQFEARHIASVCQRVLPHLSIVPHSFFSYQTPSEPIYCLYLELEKRDGESFAANEVSPIQDALIHEIPHSIEQLSHTLFMPQNEEEIMRNILLVSQEIRYVRDIPQMIISFQGQSDSTLRFHITLLRIVKEQDTPTIETLFTKVEGLVDFISGACKIVGHVRKTYPKEANTFILECKKAHFMRLDHSVDLSRAREFIAAAIRKAVGDVRDFNGGLMSQQNQQLVNVKELLNEEERKEELHLENLFHSIQPVLMRSLVAPEHMKKLFGHFLLLHNEKPAQFIPRFRESFEHNAYCIMVCSEDPSLADDLQKHIKQGNFKEQELASSTLLIDEVTYCSYIFLSTQSERLITFSERVHSGIEQFSKTKKGEQTLRISLPRPTSSLDPRIGTDRTSGIVIKMLYDGLIRIDPSGMPTPAVAQSIDISADQKRYLFTLRKSKWTNGKPVTAYDFEYAWKKVLDPHFRTPFAYLFYPIKNARDVKLGKKPVDELGVYVKDDYTLEVQLEHPAPFFLEHCAHWIYSPLCKEVDKLHPCWSYYGDDTYVSNGPFRLSKWKRNNEIQVLKNPLYWDADTVQLRRIDISIVEDPNRALDLYQRGELDWIGEPLSEIPPEAFKRQNFAGKICKHPIAAVHWYSCNLKVAPFTSKKCRTALAIALNRQGLVDKLFQGSELPAYSILPPGLSQHESPYFSDANFDEARRLFKEGLEELGLEQQKLTPFMISCCDQEIHRSIAETVSQQWKEVLGVETKIETFKWDRFMEKCWQRDFQIMGMTWYSWVYDPSYNLEHLHSLSHEMNFAQWQNSDYTGYLDKAQMCIDKKERLEYFHQAENIVMEEIPVIPLFYYTFKYMKKDYLNKIYLSHLGQIDFKWAEMNVH
jgi:oligopeptide transport system substrate-binding protein